MTLWLVGMMGTGKTTAGSMAASRLGVGFADSDTVVEEMAGCRIDVLWEQDGEEAFRALEKEAVARLAGFEGIVATGGGAVLDSASRALMSGTVAWLKASPEVIAVRLGGSDRPLLEGHDDAVGRVASILRSRSGLYEEVATCRIETDGESLETVAQRIAAAWTG